MLECWESTSNWGDPSQAALLYSFGSQIVTLWDMGAVMDDCTRTMEQVCGSSPLEASSKGEEPHNCSFVPVQSSMTAAHCPCAVIHDCAPCGSSPLLEASKGEEPHTCSIVPVQSSMTAPMSQKVTIWLPKEYKRGAWLGSSQLLVDWQEDNTSLPPSLSP